MHEAYFAKQDNALTIVKNIETRFRVMQRIGELLYGNKISHKNTTNQDRCMYEIKTWNMIKDMLWNSIHEKSIDEEDNEKKCINVERLA